MRGIPKVLSAVAALLLVASLPASEPAPNLPQPPKIVASPAAPVAEQPKLPVGAPVPLDPGKFVFLDVTGAQGPITWEFSTPGVIALLPDGATAVDYYPGVKQGESTPAWHKAPTKSSVPCLGVKQGAVTVSAWGVLDGRAKKLAALTLQVGPAPPDEPKPVEPKPQPVTSFRVILGYESGQTMTQAQTNVLFGSVVETWLNENCTGGKAGWRRRDKDSSGDADPTMAALWSAIKPQITAVPFAAVEVNGKVEIIPLEATPAAMVEKFKTYRGVK